MTRPLSGVRVLEIASYVFVPMGGAVLSEWGADVIKIEHPQAGDPARGLVTSGFGLLPGAVDPRFHAANRGKRSIGLNLQEDEGRQIASRLLAGCDVLVTNLKLATLRRLRLDVEHVRRDNPSIIYVRGSAFGPKGPDADRGGFDAGAYWGRSGMQQIFTRPDDDWPAWPKSAFGDVVAGLTVAGAIGTALFHRSMTGEPSVVDVSLLASGMWQIQSDLINAVLAAPEVSGAKAGPEVSGSKAPSSPDRYAFPNPLILPYRTRDGRFISLQMLAPERHWPGFCKAIGQPDMAIDERFADIAARRTNSRACVEWLDGVFAGRDYQDWLAILNDFAGEWVPIQHPQELPDDPQVDANRYITQVNVGDGITVPMVASPVQFNEQPNEPTRGPEHGEHTELILLEVGLSWDEITDLKQRGVVL